ncbi:hypothetical protein ANN_09330 [Periplaneta americana]|uniref:Uncharacterized protein n=1 Tax=Periplaneta americana TaxID=6978 RepID=A0ABQ8TL27_PERAM|nr:hypothetical protein ANN_09330 [Periplaneta americana]
MDRKFISIFLATESLKEKITTVGTMRSDRRDLPTELRPVSLKMPNLEQLDSPSLKIPPWSAMSQRKEKLCQSLHATF